MADLLITGAAGLNTFRRALEVTGHNVSNVNTEGYSRQRTEIVAGVPQLTAGGFMGSGSRTDNVTRVYQDYLTQQINTSYTYQNKYKATDIYSTQLNGTLGDPDTGIFTTMQGYFESWHNMANDPATNSSARFVLESGNALQQQVQTYRNTRNDLHQQVNGQIKSTLEQVNQLTSELVRVNEQLGTVTSQSTLNPNDLLDKRDQLVKQLNQYVDVKVFASPNGVIDVYTSDGKVPLITDNRTIPLQMDYNPMQKFDTLAGTVVRSEKQEIWIQQPGTGQRVIVSDYLRGGELSGALAFRKEQLTRAEDELGLSVVGMAVAMNAQHRQGFDKAGVRGSDLFGLNTQATVLMPTASGYATQTNTGTQTMGMAGAPTSAFAYKLTYNGASYDITDAYSNASIASGVTAAALAGGVTYNGVTITSGAGTPNTGDSFMVYTTSDFHKTLEQTAYKDGRNSGTLPDSAIKINLDKTGLSSDPTDLSNPADYAQVMSQLGKLQARSYRMTFDGSNYSLSDSRTGQVVAATATTVGATTTLRFEGLQVDIDTSAGTLNPGDRFEFRFLNDSVTGYKQQITNADAVAYRGADASGRAQPEGNNVNAANLSSLQERKLFLNGTENIQGAYSVMAGNVGAYHRANEVSMDTQDALFKQLNETRESIAGVSLDEEAANLMKFQQAYQAAAQIMQTSQKLFDIVIGTLA